MSSDQAQHIRELMNSVRTAKTFQALSYANGRVLGYLEGAKPEGIYQLITLANDASDRRFSELMSDMYGKKAA